MEYSLKRKLLTAFGITTFVLLSISLVSIVTFQNFVKSQEVLNHTNDVLQTLDHAASAMKDAETGQRGYLLTRDSKFLEPYIGSRAAAQHLVQRVQGLTADNPLQQRNIIQISKILTKRLSLLDSILKKSQRQTVTVDDLNQGKLAMDSFRKAISKAEMTEDELLRKRLQIHEKNVRYARFFIFAAVVVVILTSIISYLNIARGLSDRAKILQDLKKREQETADLNEELEAANEEMAAINEELLTGNEELTQAREKLQYATLSLEQKVLRRTTELALSRAKALNILESIPQIAWTNTLTGEVDFYNRRWFEYTGLDFDQTKAWGWKAVIHPEDIEHNIRRYQEILHSGQAGEFEVREKRSDKQYRWHLVRLAPLIDSQGQLHSWVGTATDIQELKEIQQQKDDFLNFASHELKTPLTSLKSSLQLLDVMKSRLSTEKLNELILRSNNSVNRIISLVQELLQFGRISQGRLKLHKSMINLSELINDCAVNLNFYDKFQVVHSGEINVHVEVDEDQLGQVINSFLSNVIKYAPASKQVEIAIRTGSGIVRVSVTDQGAGVPQEILPHLFDRYFRAQQNGAPSSGLGIGLYISSEIIKKHGGSIGVENKEGQGSTFWFSLTLQNTIEPKT